MLSLCLLLFARFLHLSFCPPQPPKESCSCCCCGTSTDDVENGELTGEQACCTPAMELVCAHPAVQIAVIQKTPVIAVLMIVTAVLKSKSTPAHAVVVDCL